MIEVLNTPSPTQRLASLFARKSPRCAAQVGVSVRSISGLMKSFLQGNEKRKRLAK